MKNARSLLFVAATVAAAGSAHADLTYTPIGISGEPALSSIFRDAYSNIGTGAVLSTSGNDFTLTFDGGRTLKAVRYADGGTDGVTPFVLANPDPSSADQVFQDGTVTTTSRSRYSSNGQFFGYTNGQGTGNFTDLFEVQQGLVAYGDAGPGFTGTLSSEFQFARSSFDDGSGDHFSINANNAGGLDHLVTYRLIDSAGLLNGGGITYFMGFEDTGAGRDGDFNDLVVELSVVPLPPAAWAGLGSLVGVAGLRALRRRAQQA